MNSWGNHAEHGVLSGLISGQEERRQTPRALVVSSGPGAPMTNAKIFTIDVA
jgi:hypothetical protein